MPLSPRATALLILAACWLLLIASRLFRDMEMEARPLFASVLLGAVVAAAVRFGLPNASSTTAAVVTAALLTLAIWQVTRNAADDSSISSMLLSSMIGVGFAFVLIFSGPVDYRILSAPLVATALAGFLRRLGRGFDRPRPLLWFSSSFVAIAASLYLVPRLQMHPHDSSVMMFAAFGVPLIGFCSVFVRRKRVLAELREEADMGVFDPKELATVTHPWKRFQAAGWADLQARRRFVKLATALAGRKRHQRVMSKDRARLYQLEILQLRREISNVLGVESAVTLRRSEPAEIPDLPSSDRIPLKGSSQP